MNCKAEASDVFRSVKLELLTHQNFVRTNEIMRDDISEAYVDSAKTLMELTEYGIANNCKGHTYLLILDERCIGIILLGEAILWETDPEQMRVEPFYRLMGYVIDKKYRGKGIGGYVLEQVIDKIYREFGIRPIALGVHRENISAARFYERHGFVKTDATEGHDRYFLRYPK